MKARYYAAGAAMTAIAAATFLWFLPGLPAEVPVHWNIHGVADRHGSPWHLFALGPGAMAGTLLLFALMPWFSPKRFEVDASLRTYLNLMLILVACFGYFFAVALWAAAHGPVGTDRAIVGGVCLLFVLLGNLLGKVRRNFFIGIRTPWTLASERVWYATHRMAGWLLVVAGLLAGALLLAGAPSWLSIALIVVASFVPVVYSLVRYKSLEKSGELDVAA